MPILERRHIQSHISWLAGIDEVGRGPLAGPVSVCVCVIPFAKNRKNTYKLFLKQYKEDTQKLRIANIYGKDSKKLKEDDRIEWKNFLGKTHAQFFYATLSAEDIDTKGIAVCISKLIKKNLNACLKNKDIQNNNTLILLDGGLKAPKKYIHQETIVKGDEKEMVISFASIYAKVTRDAYMKKIAKTYPDFGFEVHKGYGTLKHRNMIRKLGETKIHRKTFLKNIRLT